ncbi:mannosyltransferase, partial [Coemansia sp. RSA 2681]
LCFRSVGLWLFRSADGSRTGLAADAANTRGDTQPFNVVDEHRTFCYWAHGSAATPEKPGSSNTPANATSASAVPGWQKTIASILRAKTMSNENNGSSSEASSDADAGEASSGTDDDGSGTDKDSDKAGMGQDEVMFKRLKPFNISAISAAAEAFGIPFSMGLLARATKKLALMTGVAEPSPQSSILTTTSADEHPRFDFLDDPLLAGAHSGWESDRLARADMDSDTDLVEHGNAVEEQSNDDQDDGITSSIDTSGLASLLGDSSLASALEDPAQAHAILEYSSGGKARQRKSGRDKHAPATASMEERKRVAILVLGDIGRSPRMQYHALSLAKAGLLVDLIGYADSTPMEGILASPDIRIRHLQSPPQPPSSAPRMLFYLYAPLKVVYQLVVLFWMMLATITRPDYILIQVRTASRPTDLSGATLLLTGSCS